MYSVNLKVSIACTWEYYINNLLEVSFEVFLYSHAAVILIFKRIYPEVEYRSSEVTEYTN